ncbi:MAG TPA: multidrug transporter, partial [Burkholderiaceae bacterium]|nr:multidrug transporter [Burkholderiaceae bacterium]
MKTPFLTPIAVAAATCLLAACNTMAPHYERPAAPVAAAFPGAAASAAAPGTG